MSEPRTQREWYEYYKSIALDKNYSTSKIYSALFDEVTQNRQLHPFTQFVILQTLQKFGDQTDISLEPYLTRQQDIALTKYLHGFNVSNVPEELPQLQKEVDDVKEAVWSGESKDMILEELADVIIRCYMIAQIIGGNLDDIIFKKMKFDEQRFYLTDIE